MRKIFGTDGIRGTANREPMTSITALKAAMAAAAHFAAVHPRRKIKVVIGKDTRRSGYMIENAMASGFLAMGLDVVFLGPLPTPAVAHLTRSMRADLGVMISASHNPYHDNGIKFFSSRGEKLSDAVEKEIEHYMNTLDFEKHLASPENIGAAKRLDDETGRYIEYLKSTFPKDMSLNGVRIVLDCANGAAYKVAPKLLWELGADVITIGDEPNGFNINEECGATHIEMLQKRTVEEKAHIGLALDGDADRLIVCDENGKRVDGDQILALVATDYHRENRLKNNGVVATVMSNMGLEKYLEKNGMHLIRTQVGDRYVTEHMRDNGYNLGGEESGHFVAADYMPTGDGLMAALIVLSIMIKRGEKASDLLHVFEKWPQVLQNVRYSDKNPLEKADVADRIQELQTIHAADTRILIRKSGTEPLIRVMAEGTDLEKVEQIVNEICDIIRKNI